MWNKVRTIIRVGQKYETQVKIGQEGGTTRTRGITDDTRENGDHQNKTGSYKKKKNTSS